MLRNYRIRETTRMTMMTTTLEPSQSSSHPPPSSSNLFNNFTSISDRLADRLGASGIASNLTTNLLANFENLISGMKNFLPAVRNMTVTRIT